VYTTGYGQLEPDFTVKWAQIFNIYMIEKPDCICLELFDCFDSKISASHNLIAQLNIPTPEVNCTIENYNLEEYEFASSIPFYMRSKSNRDLNASLNESQLEPFFTCGIIMCGAGWGVDEKSGFILAPTQYERLNKSAIDYEEMKNYDAVAALGVSHMQDIEKLAKWIFKSNLDPNDPRNGKLTNLIRVKY
jgi:hypothetical protein